MPKCTDGTIGFGRLGRRVIEANFEGSDIGSDGSTVADRARNAGYAGAVSETTAINPALAISGIELINQWYHRPDYNAIMSNCANVDIGVWSANLIDRTVVVAVYGTGDGAPPVQSPGRPFGAPGAGAPG